MNWEQMESIDGTSPAAGEQTKVDNKGIDGQTLPIKKPGSKAQGRKRTKSGCLTCRKRRIKCGEERPTCQNCTKSKRQCEGYNQRVVFKDPLNAYRPSLSGSHPPYGPRSSQPHAQRGEIFQQQSTNTNPLPIAPKPKEDITRRHGGSHNPSPGIEHQMFVFPVDHKPITPTDQRNAINGADRKPDTIDRSNIPDPQRTTNREPPVHYDFNSLVKQERRETLPPKLVTLDWSAGQSSGSTPFSQELFYDSNRQFPAAVPFHQPYPVNPAWEPLTPASASSTTTFQTRPVNGVSPSIQTEHENAGKPQWRFTAHEEPKQEPLRIVALVPPQAKADVLVIADHQEMIDDEEDPFDVSEGDVDMEDIEDHSAVTMWHGGSHDHHLQNNDLGIVVALQAGQENHGLRMRSFVDFIDRPDMLSSYSPSIQSSPLKDPMTARIFCHFINVTAPSISMFERNPANPSLIFQGTPVPKSQQHIWTYTFPTLAMQSPALLHAMLALACLHISQLQDTPVTQSLKHYHISLRRVGRALRSPSKRLQPATLAAAMLLGFYECWCADHQKWTNHLLGAKHLLNEIDFVGISKHIKKSKQQHRQDQRNQYYEIQQRNGVHGFVEDTTRFQTVGDDIDENIVGMLMGKKLSYDEYGQIVEDAEAAEQDNNQQREYTAKDIEVYETQRDLWWWYAKQDMYQSILGGGKLFLNYKSWSRCLPRAPLGRLNATYGTYDHVILLLGRVAAFAAKDLKRKRAAAKATGGWRPPGSMRPPESEGLKGPRGPPQGFGSPPNQGPGPGQGRGQGPPQMPQMPQMPTFSGMLPVSGEVKLPMGFEDYRQTSPSSPQSSTSSNQDFADIEAQRLEAEEEWQEIRNMFSVLVEHFGPDFQAMGPEFTAPVQTPFGTALQYRTYGIAGIWMNYYMGLIACHRAHPSMPPAAMIAAGIAARQTASMANEIGRIAAGLAPGCNAMEKVSPSVGAGLIESATCLFISGVQYQDPHQRHWTVTRLRDIARLTGWQTSIAIATGCETSWVKAGEAGHGPPYNRTSDKTLQRHQIWDTGRRADRANAERDGENRLVLREKDRAYYALGVLGLEEHFEGLVLVGEDGVAVDGDGDEVGDVRLDEGVGEGRDGNANEGGDENGYRADGDDQGREAWERGS